MSAAPFLPPLPAVVAKGFTMLSVDLIDAVDRRRETTEAAVAMMADSLEATGLISPILVRPVAEDRYRLVIGAHRLAAAKLLGWEQIRCEVRDLDELDASNLEVTENLKRHELDKLDFGLFCAEAKELDERIAQRAMHGGARRGSNRQVGDMLPRFTAELAERIGRGERTVQRAIAIVKALDPEAIRTIRGTKYADNEQSLFKLSAMAPAQQRAAALDLRDGRYKTVAAARDALEGKSPAVPNPDADNLAALLTVWMRSSSETRQSFLNDIGAVFVSTAAEQAAPAKPRRGVKK